MVLSYLFLYKSLWEISQRFFLNLKGDNYDKEKK